MSQSAQSDHNRVQLEGVWLSELGQDLRARTQAEYVYTAASIAMFGAVCGGVGGQRHHHQSLVFVAAVFILVGALAVTLKIWVNHKKYGKTWEARSLFIDRLSTRQELANLFPNRVRKQKPGRGFWYSLAVLWVPAVFAIIFCVKAYWSH